MHNCRPGIALLQLIIGMAMLAIIGAKVAPNLLGRMPLYQRQEFVSTLNSLAQQSWIGALETGNAYKIIFNLNKQTIKIEEKTAEFDEQGEPVFKSVMIDSVGSYYEWPEHLEIKQFFVEGVDEIAQHAAGRTMEDVWFFIVPEGMAQAVVINLIDTKDTHYDIEGQEISLVLNPFRVQFEVYEEFVTPTA